MAKVLDDRSDEVAATDPPPAAGSAGGPPTGSSGGGPGGNGLTRVTVNLNRQAMQALERISADTGYSKTDTINRALQVYAIVHEIMQRDSGMLRVKHQDGEVERIHIV